MDPLLRRTHAAWDVAVQSLVRRARAEGHSIPCKLGCDACCYDVARTLGVEAPELAERVRAMPTVKRQRVVEAIRAWFAGMWAAGLDPANISPDIQAYHRAHLACPLLDIEHHRCMVYDIRPLACRGHYVVAPDARVCANRAEVPEVTTLEYEDETIDKVFAGILGCRPQDLRRSALSEAERQRVTPELLTTALARELDVRLEAGDG